jgi:ABC-type lipoprotein export system ATPase subunit
LVAVEPSMTALSINNLRFRYDSAATQNNGEATGWTVNIPHLQLERGEQLLLTGSSGRGKSTLLYLIAGLVDPHAGDVVIDGQRISDLHGAKRDLFRGSRIGMIFQTFNLLHGFTAEENVMAALMFSDPKKFPPSSHRGRAGKLLAHLGIDRPHAQADRLSVGQQQRVAVARAVACDPVLVLADEPTASLDPDSGATAMDLIQQSCREINAALLCVSHDPSMAQRFERRASLDELAKEAKSQAC